jgi:hypothetical protein
MGAFVTVTSTDSPSATPSVTMVHSDAEHAGAGGQLRYDVVRGVVGHAGLNPGMVTVTLVGRRSTVLVHPSPAGGVCGPVQLMGGTQGGAIQMVEV